VVEASEQNTDNPIKTSFGSLIMSNFQYLQMVDYGEFRMFIMACIDKQQSIDKSKRHFESRSKYRSLVFYLKNLDESRSSSQITLNGS